MLSIPSSPNPYLPQSEQLQKTDWLGVPTTICYTCLTGNRIAELNHAIPYL